MPGAVSGARIGRPAAPGEPARLGAEAGSRLRGNYDLRVGQVGDVLLAGQCVGLGIDVVVSDSIGRGGGVLKYARKHRRPECRVTAGFRTLSAARPPTATP